MRSAPSNGLAPKIVLCLAMLAICPRAIAQPILPAADGTGTLVTPEGDRFDIDGGQTSADGRNLFHSFERFGLNEGQIANFLANPNLENILGRVTGGEASFINGLIQVTGGDPNLFLLNPAGIVFGADASLNVPADFTATTATGIGFDGGWFHAAGETNWSSLVGNPNAFDFSTLNPGAIVNEGNLAVPPDANLNLIGGIVLNTGSLQAPGGDITLTAVPGESLVRLDSEGNVMSLEVGNQASGFDRREWNVTPLSLPQLLAGGEEWGHATEIAMNPDGTISLAGSGMQLNPQTGDAIVSGIVDVSNASSPSPEIVYVGNAEEVYGGNVDILGDRIGLFEAGIDASGTDFGGNVHIGSGIFTNNGSFPLASRTWIDRNSFIFANGNDGSVTVAANEVTGFYGQLEATRGDVRISGKDNLIFEGLIDVRGSDEFGKLALSSSNILVSEGSGDSTPTEEAVPNIFQDRFEDRGLVLTTEVLDRQTGEVGLRAIEDLTVATSLTFDPTRMWIGLFEADSDGDNIGSFSNLGYSIRAEDRPISISGASVTIGSIDTSLENGNGGDSGGINIQSSVGNLDITGNLVAGGGIYLYSLGGDITTGGDLISRGLVVVSIVLESDRGDITTAGSLITGSIVGSHILLTSQNGSIDTTRSTIESLGLSEGYRSIELIASRDVAVNTINIAGSCDGSPCNGTISLNSRGELTVLGTLDPGIGGTQILNAGGNLNLLGEGETRSQSFADDIADFSGNIYLQGEGDVTIDTPINANESVQIRAGRNLNINANINTASVDGNIVLRGNNEEAAALGTRPPGAGSLTQAPGTTLNAGSGNILLELGSAGEAGNLTIGDVNTSGTVVVNSNGGNIYRAAENTLVRAGAAVFRTGESSGIGTLLQPIQIDVGHLEAQAWNGGVFFKSPTSVTIGGVTDLFTGISTIDGGDIVVMADGNIIAIEEIYTCNPFPDTGDIILESRNGAIDIAKVDASNHIDVSINDTNVLPIEAGTIRLVAPNGITANSLRAYGNHRSGNITLSSTASAINVESIEGRNASVEALEDISVGSINTESNLDLTTQTGDIYTRSLSADDRIVLNTPQGNLEIGDIRSFGDGGQIIFNVGGIITAGEDHIGRIDSDEDILINSPVNLSGHVWLESRSGQVLLNGPVDGNHDLSINAQRVQINENIGHNNPLNRVTIGGRGGEITTQDIRAEGGIFLSGEEISTGLLDSSSLNQGGDVTLEADGNITVPAINAQSLGDESGGDVKITANDFLRVTDSFFDRNRIDASISTAGGAEGGLIRIQHGGDSTTPFFVRDASVNGTAGAITRGNGIEETISSGEFYIDHSQDEGRISISPIDEPPFPDDRVPPENLPMPERMDTDFTSDDAVVQIERRFESQFEEYLGANLVDGEEITTEVMRETLRTIEAQTGEKAAIIYALTHPPKAPAEVLETDSKPLTLMLVLPDGSPQVKTVTLDAESSSLDSTIGLFLHQLQSYNSNSYRPLAQTLYRWLIQPLESELIAHEIDTLLFSMDAGLRQIPIAALHDGEQFLMEKYNLGLIPSLNLTDTRYRSLQGDRVLAMGMSEFAELAPLPAVPLELATIVGVPESRADFARKSQLQTPSTATDGLWPGEVFLNEEFTLENLIGQRQQQHHHILHLATHARFDRSDSEGAYIQFWDERLSLDELRQVGGFAPPVVDLLVLSACQTAVGNETSEMGIAGLAVRAGVKSVLASLWSVSDLGTLAMMSQFYGDLRQSPIKAEALRQAQLALLRGEVRIEGGELVGDGIRIPLPPELQGWENRDLSHPYYWAGFTLVGSPWSLALHSDILSVAASI